MEKGVSWEKGFYLRPRFSPGYGDFPLSAQKQILDGLEAGKTDRDHTDRGLSDDAVEVGDGGDRVSLGTGSLCGSRDAEACGKERLRVPEDKLKKIGESAMGILELMKERSIYFDEVWEVFAGRGPKPGELPETWNLPDRRSSRRSTGSTLDAGSDVVTTNTCANHFKLKEEDGYFP